INHGISRPHITVFRKRPTIAKLLFMISLDVSANQEYILARIRRGSDNGKSVLASCAFEPVARGHIVRKTLLGALAPTAANRETYNPMTRSLASVSSLCRDSPPRLFAVRHATRIGLQYKAPAAKLIARRPD